MARPAAHRAVGVAGLHDEAVGALDGHVVVKSALDEVHEVARRHRRVVAVDHDAHDAALHHERAGLRVQGLWVISNDAHDAALWDAYKVQGSGLVASQAQCALAAR